MGTSTSKASPLAPTFERMATWDLKASRGLLQTYKDKDMDFGLDSQGLADLIGGDKDWAEGIIDAFRSPTGIINALAFVCGACLVSSGPALEKAGMIFDALDFDGTQQISMDEMTISLLCCARGFCVMAGVGTVPSDEELESVTLQAYRDLNKESTQSITKSEFTKWILEFASGTGAPPTREVTLQNALEQFRVVPASKHVEEKEDNNIISPQEGDEEPIDEDAHTGKLDVDEPPKQEADENALQFVPDQEYKFIEKAIELPGLIEPEFVATDVDEHAPSGFPDGTGQATVQIDPEDNTLVDGNDQGEEKPQTGGLVDQVAEGHAEVTLGDEPEQQITKDSHGSGIGADDDHAVTADTESDFPTFVTDVDEAALANYAQCHSPSTDEQTNELRAEETLEKETTDMEIQQDNANNNRNIETEDIEPAVASEKREVKESRPEPISTAKLENDDVEYEQDEFAQGTPRPDDSPPGEDADTQPLENREGTTQSVLAPIETTAEVAEQATNTGEHEVTSDREVTENGANVDETLAPVTTPDQEPTTAMATSENAEAGEEALSDAVTTVIDPEVASSHTDLNYQDPRFDGSPPEPQELQDDGTVTAVGNDLGDANASAAE